MDLIGYPHININNPTITDASCNGYKDGAFTLNVTGGNPPLSYFMRSPTDSNKTGIFDSLVRGTYVVRIVDSTGCFKETTVVINHPDTLVAGTIITPNDCIGYDDGGAVEVTSRGGTPPYSYLWSTTPQQTAGKISGLPNGKYAVIVTDAHRCADTTIALVPYDNCCKPVIPDAFTPNGDGRNDRFRVLFKGDVKLESFSVYNRYGQRIFYTTATEAGWDGTWNDRNQDAGTYFYYIRLVCGNKGNNVQEYKGDITLIREIVSVTGIGGLYQLLSTKSDGAIVRNLADNTTKFISARLHNVTPLESIEIYTIGNNVRLHEVLDQMQKSEKSKPDAKKASNDEIRSYFKEVYPDIDEDRVYVSDMKKMLKWFDLLKSNNLLDFSSLNRQQEDAAAGDADAEAQRLDFEAFEGNANAFRILTHSFNEPEPGGYKLTYATLASVIKYPCSSAAGFDKKTGLIATKKSGFFDSERTTYQQIADKAVAGNGFTKWVITAKDLEALGYLMYAKQCEPLVNTAGDWDAPERDTVKMGKLIRNGLQLQKAAKKDFIRDRYNYQVIRLAFYAGNPSLALDLYNTLAASNTGNSEIQARTLALKGGALFRLKRKPEAAYCYALAFDKSDNIKTTSFQSFDWCVGKDATPVLKLCKTPHEKAVVWVMNGLHHYDQGLPSMQAAYQADPSVAGLDVVMTREINKTEERYQARVLSSDRNLTASSYWFNDYASYYNGDEGKASEEKNKNEKLQDARSFLQRSAKTDFERWLIDSVGYTTASLTELEGTKYLRRFEFEKAAASFSGLGDSADLPDPFIAHISDKYELDPIDTKTLYSKLTFARKMAGLQKKINAAPNDAQALFQYATGLYSISYYGKSTYNVTYYRSSTDPLSYFNSDQRKSAPVYTQEYYGAITAEKLFAQAAANTTDAELKGKALFMAAKCWQKRCETGKAQSYYDQDMIKLYYNNSLNNPYFKQLKNEASSTKLYQEALNTCGYFNDYATKQK
ncbi:putative dGTPase [Ostertagia ostertagi]